jgi:hypothetical protein
VCLLNQDGDIVGHRNLTTKPDALLPVMMPCRGDIVGAVAWILTWSRLAGRCAQAGIPLVLGQARSMKAIPGGKAKHDPIDAHRLAVLLRGGMLPRAYVYPAEVRAARDVLRRRVSLPRQRAALLTHVQQTNGPENLPAIGKHIASQANREGVAERFPAPAVQTSLAVDLARLGDYDRLLTALELTLVLLYEIPDTQRFPRVQALVSSCRLVPCAKASAGKRYGTSGTKMGKADLTWAFSEAAGLSLRNNPAGPKALARLGKQRGQGQALTLLAHG